MSRVAAVTGLGIEAAIARRAGLEAAASGAVSAMAVELAERFVRAGARGLVSFGIAGGLAPSLPTGALILAEAVEDGGAVLPCDSAWLARAAGLCPDAYRGLLAAREAIIGTAAEKAELARSGALAVDMESGAVARVARSHGVPLLVVRAVADRAEDEIPPAAAMALLPGGARNRAFAGALLRDPLAAVALARLGWRTARALAALRAAAAALGRDLALP